MLSDKFARYCALKARAAVAMVTLLSLAGMAGCRASGPVEDPLARTVTWYSYLAGDSLRAACGAGASDRYRFVYNAVYEEQVRTYDLVIDRPLPGTQGQGRPVGGVLHARAFSPGQGLLAYPLSATRFGGGEARTPLGPREVAVLLEKIRASGFFGPPPVGEFLRSDRFYWVASACVDGRFHFNAWQEPPEDLSNLAFPKVLFAFDETGVRVNPVRPNTGLGPFQTGGPKGEFRGTPRFRVQVGENGLVGP